jgi:hypothetical protein
MTNCIFFTLHCITDKYFKDVQKRFEDALPQNIYIYDETKLQNNPWKIKMHFIRETKHSECVQNYPK